MEEYTNLKNVTGICRARVIRYIIVTTVSSQKLNLAHKLLNLFHTLNILHDTFIFSLLLNRKYNDPYQVKT